MDVQRAFNMKATRWRRLRLSALCRPLLVARGHVRLQLNFALTKGAAIAWRLPTPGLFYGSTTRRYYADEIDPAR